MIFVYVLLMDTIMVFEFILTPIGVEWIQHKQIKTGFPKLIDCEFLKRFNFPENTPTSAAPSCYLSPKHCCVF